jgi:putative nucleotidyltransferase with HDIG domain
LIELFASNVFHLCKRFTYSLCARRPDEAQIMLVQSVLSPNEMHLWTKSAREDQQHSLVVLKRLLNIMPDAGQAAQAAALLHDIGKIESDLGTFLRVVATVGGPRTKRFAKYHDHEQIGLKMLEEAGSSPEIIALVSGNGDPKLVAILALADDI